MNGSVLVLDGKTRAALAVTRSLGRHGVAVTVGESTYRPLSAWSRYCERAVVYPDPSTHPEDFAECILDEAKRGDYDLVIPVTDLTMCILSSERDELSKLVRLALPPENALSAVMDKGNLIRMAREYEVPVPKTWDVHETDRSSFEGGLSFPMVVKSRMSMQKVWGQWVKGEVRVAHNALELVDSFSAINHGATYPLVQEYIPGWGEGIFFLCNRGEVRSVFAHRRVCETPPDGGVSTLRESIPVNPRLFGPLRALLRDLCWHGIVMFEFRVDARDGVPKLMEVNPRFWGSLHLAIVSGQDFPWQLYRMVVDGDIRSSIKYECGIRSSWLLGGLNQRLVDAVSGTRVQTSDRSKLSKSKNSRRTYREIECATDPGPAICEYGLYIAETVGAVARRVIGRR